MTFSDAEIGLLQVDSDTAGVIYNMAPILIRASRAVPLCDGKWPDGLDLQKLCIPFDPYDVVISHHKPATQRGKPYEVQYVQSLVARYYLLVRRRPLEGGKWVPLTELLGYPANAAVLRNWKVDLSGGISVPRDKEAVRPVDHTVTHNIEFSTAHHDTYLFARRGGSEEPSFIALQLRHGAAKTASELEPQAPRKKKPRTTKVASEQNLVPCLLSVRNGEASIVITSEQPNLQTLASTESFATVDGTRIARDAAVYALTPYTLRVTKGE